MTTSMADVAEALARACPRSRVERDAPLGARTTYRVGGPAAVLVELAVPEEAAAAAAVMAGASAPMVVVGRGSNLLVADAGFDGVAVALGEGFDHETITGRSVTAGGARSLPVLARSTVAAGLTGFEWAVGVPGSVGGAVRMNAGGHGSDMAASLRSAAVVDFAAGEVRRWAVAELGLAYRHSVLGPTQVVTEATIELAEGDRRRGEATLSSIVRWRREHQPGGANAGSVFTNPEGDSAGRLIEAVGAKGLRLGTAQVSSKHANFIQADPGGSADDIRRLMTEVRRRVLEATGVTLTAETRLIGFGPDEEDPT